MPSHKKFAALVLAFAALPLIGCGGPSVPVGSVSGTVTIDGQPASGVTVSFQPVESGRGSTGVTNEEGYYELVYSASTEGALIGKHKVGIRGPEPGFDDAATATSAVLKESASIKPEYLRMQKDVEVTAGSNTIDLTYP